MYTYFDKEKGIHISTDGFCQEVPDFMSYDDNLEFDENGFYIDGYLRTKLLETRDYCINGVKEDTFELHEVIDTRDGSHFFRLIFPEDYTCIGDDMTLLSEAGKITQYRFIDEETLDFGVMEEAYYYFTNMCTDITSTRLDATHSNFNEDDSLPF